MDTVAVGTRWDTAGVALPEIAPMPDRGALGAELWLHGHLCVDPARDPLVAQVGDRIGEAQWLSAMTARYDRRLAETYLHGAGELASRASGSDAERRAWGARGMLAELACGLRLPETTLARRLARTTMLSAFPQLLEAAEQRQVSSWHCDVMLDVFAGVTDLAVLGRADEALIGRARTGTAPQLRATARRWRARHVPRTEEQRVAAVADRRVEMSPADEDMVWLSALIPAPAAAAIDRRLDAIATAAGGPDEVRTPAQVRADVFVDLLLDASTVSPRGSVAPRQDGAMPPAVSGAMLVGADPEGRGDSFPSAATGCRSETGPVPGWVRAIHAEVVLTVPVLSLLGHSDEPAELEGVGPIDIETARMLAANAPSFVRVLTHPESGAVLSVGRDRYRIPADLRRAVRLRDVTCRFPGCTRRAGRCDVDHSRAWANGGATEACNLACLCRKHHRLKHEMDWQVTQEPGGVLVWRSALGRTFRTEPGCHWPRPPTDRSTPPARTTAPSRDGRRVRRRPRRRESAGSSSGYPDEPPF